MDTVGHVSSTVSLVVHAFHLFRHVSSARSFSDTAGRMAATIAIEYFRFETWLQQSGLLTVDPASGEPIVSESSLRRAILLAAEIYCPKMDYDRVKEHFYTVLVQIRQCLTELKNLRKKYSLHDVKDDTNTASLPTIQKLEPNQEIATADILFQNTQVSGAISKDVAIRQRRSKVVSFFRKVNFTWTLKDDTNDRDRINSLIQVLKDSNDHLRELLPPVQQHSVDRVVELKTLSLSSTPADLNGIGVAASTVNDDLHREIYQAVKIKAKKAETSMDSMSEKEIEEAQLDSTKVTHEDLKMEYLSGMASKRVLGKVTSAYLTKGEVSTSTITVILEWIHFNPTLPEDDLDLLRERIARLCTLLKSAGHPYFSILPHCTGFIEKSRTSFALAYDLPPFTNTEPSHPPHTLYSILPRNKNCVESEKLKRNRILPSLEERYKLAAALADGVLSLLSVNWMHKNINSRNVALYYNSAASSHQSATLSTVPVGLDFSSPQFLGFGVARRERPGERTIDLRDGNDSPWRFWQHPSLCTSSGHRPFTRAFDIFSLGVILFEIGMWSDAHYFSVKEGRSRHPEEFRRTIVNACANEMAHKMGESYKTAVMACLDKDELWNGHGDAALEGSGSTADADEGGTVAATGGDDISKTFYVHVYSVLRRCCKAA